MSEININDKMDTEVRPQRSDYFKIFLLPVITTLITFICIFRVSLPRSIDFLNVVIMCSVIIELFMGYREANNRRKLCYFVSSIVM